MPRTQMMTLVLDWNLGLVLEGSPWKNRGHVGSFGGSKVRSRYKKDFGSPATSHCGCTKVGSEFGRMG